MASLTILGPGFFIFALMIDLPMTDRPIPVTFEFKGKNYRGELSMVRGMGTAGGHYFLMVNNRYWGTLFISSNKDPRWGVPPGEPDYVWHFRDYDDEMRYMVDYFVDVLIAWFQ